MVARIPGMEDSYEASSPRNHRSGSEDCGLALDRSCDSQASQQFASSPEALRLAWGCFHPSRLAWPAWPASWEWNCSCASSISFSRATELRQASLRSTQGDLRFCSTSYSTMEASLSMFTVSWDDGAVGINYTVSREVHADFKSIRKRTPVVVVLARVSIRRIGCWRKSNL